MTTRGISRILVAVSAAFIGVAALQWRRATPSNTRDQPRIPLLRSETPVIPADSLAAWEATIAANDAFRLSNSPAAVAYDPATDGVSSGSLAGIVQPRPTLVLKAIVGGPPWQAVIDGIPGQPPGTIARAGSRFDRLVVRVVTRDSVVVHGVDTSWVLSFRAK